MKIFLEFGFTRISNFVAFPSVLIRLFTPLSSIRIIREIRG